MIRQKYTMKYVLGYSIIFLGLCLSCKQQDDLVSPRPEQKSAKALSAYNEQLTKSTYGWKAFLFPGVGGGYSFLMEFSNKGRVIMTSDINSTTASRPYESSYRLDAEQRPSLIFDTYSYLHLLSDP